MKSLLNTGLILALGLFNFMNFARASSPRCEAMFLAHEDLVATAQQTAQLTYEMSVNSALYSNPIFIAQAVQQVNLSLHQLLAIDVGYLQVYSDHLKSLRLQTKIVSVEEKVREKKLKELQEKFINKYAKIPDIGEVNSMSFSTSSSGPRLYKSTVLGFETLFLVHVKKGTGLPRIEISVDPELTFTYTLDPKEVYVENHKADIRNFTEGNKIIINFKGNHEFAIVEQINEIITESSLILLHSHQLTFEEIIEINNQKLLQEYGTQNE
jgi:hypothetical protein